MVERFGRREFLRRSALAAAGVVAAGVAGAACAPQTDTGQREDQWGGKEEVGKCLKDERQLEVGSTFQVAGIQFNVDKITDLEATIHLILPDNGGEGNWHVIRGTRIWAPAEPNKDTYVKFTIDKALCLGVKEKKK